MAQYLVKHKNWKVKFKYIKTYTNSKGIDTVVCRLSNYTPHGYYDVKVPKFLNREFPLSEVELERIPSKFEKWIKRMINRFFPKKKDTKIRLSGKRKK